jgi:hypothetical protein
MKMIALVLFAMAISGCSTIRSTSLDSAAVADGLVYHLPKSDLVITIDVDDKQNPSKVTVATTALYPDTSTAYLLRHTNGLLGKHTTDIKLKNGLLSSVNAKLESRFTDAVKAIGAAAAIGEMHQATDLPCVSGTHTFIEALTSLPRKYCGGRVSITLALTGPPLAKKPAGAERPGSLDSADGVYYRQNLPFLVKVQTAPDGDSDKGTLTSTLLWSPVNSPTFFLPVSRGLFADAESTFAFEDGVPTQIKYTTDSEATAVLKLPAEIASSYFAAVGTLFSQFGQNSANQQKQLENMVKLELAKKRYEACIAAIQDGNEDLIKSLGCGTGSGN